MAKTLVYQMWPIAWEAMGGIKTMTEHLSIVKELGVDYVWVSPLYPSPRFDHGYDIADYEAIDPRFGTLEDFDEFVKTAHELGIGVLMDMVLNHTSTKHPWFTERPSYYCWSEGDKPGWKNLFDGGPAWQYHEPNGDFYLHLFHEEQADLDWFPWNDISLINHALVYEFRRIVDFWTVKYGVDGFRLDVPQAINKDFSSENLALEDLLVGEKAKKVINEIFTNGRENLFLMMECVDPTFGELTEYYTDSTPIGFVVNMLLKDEFNKKGKGLFIELIRQQSEHPKFMLDFESHDAPRFLSRDESLTHYEEVRMLFGSNPTGICLYQGQELGLRNPTKRELTDLDMLKLDIQTAMRFMAGENLDKIRPFSRANARLPIPVEQYEFQEKSEYSDLSMTKNWSEYWRKRG
ncbi:hypothetical protein IKG33_01860 [Candidatus Saccharibacteria bacterium]|nr:hypothetical protein [Candidatus Saccharibacteria bacterium]